MLSMKNHLENPQKPSACVWRVSSAGVETLLDLCPLCFWNNLDTRVELKQVSILPPWSTTYPEKKKKFAV